MDVNRKPSKIFDKLLLFFLIRPFFPKEKHFLSLILHSAGCAVQHVVYAPIRNPQQTAPYIFFPENYKLSRKERDCFKLLIILHVNPKQDGRSIPDRNRGICLTHTSFWETNCVFMPCTISSFLFGVFDRLLVF